MVEEATLARQGDAMAAAEVAGAQGDALAIAILRLLHERGDMPLAAVAKALGLRQSKLRRQISLLGHAPALGGLGLVEVGGGGGRSTRLRLSRRGRDWLAAQA